MSLVFLDTETTDLNYDARIVELAYAIDQGEIRSMMFKPEIEISIGAMSIHHITNKMVADKPSFATHCAGAINAVLEKSIIVSHNTEFDMRMLKNEKVKFNPKFNICTLQISRHLFELESHTLQYLRYYLGIELDDVKVHSAAGDVAVVRAIFDKMKEKIKEQFSIKDEKQLIVKMVNMSGQPVLLRRCKFGKHKNKLWSDIAREDKGYLQWLYNQQKDDPDPNMVFTLSHYLNNNGNQKAQTSQQSKASW